jgi:hemerythrin-like metal-binding protein
MSETVDSLSWSDAFLMGYAPMDQTHREFVAVVGALQRAPDDQVADALAAVQAHCRAHFDEEGRWMAETDMPARDCHDDEHAAVMRSIEEVLALVRSEPSAPNLANARRLADELARWFPGHADYLDSALSHWMSMRRFGGKPMVIRRAAIGGGTPPDAAVPVPGEH